MDEYVIALLICLVTGEEAFKSVEAGSGYRAHNPLALINPYRAVRGEPRIDRDVYSVTTWSQHRDRH